MDNAAIKVYSYEYNKTGTLMDIDEIKGIAYVSHNNQVINCNISELSDMSKVLSTQEIYYLATIGRLPNDTYLLDVGGKIKVKFTGLVFLREYKETICGVDENGLRKTFNRNNYIAYRLPEESKWKIDIRR